MHPSAPTANPRIVIVGAGFAGLETARTLADTTAEVIVIDRHNHHCFQPLLYQVATASLSPADIAWPIRAILRRQENVSVLMAEALGINRSRQLLLTDSGEIPFDYLVVATGVTHSYFGHADWAKFAPGLKELGDATAIRHRLLCAFERAEIAPDKEEQRRHLRFGIVGGGPTGVELAGAMAEVAYHSLRHDFRRIDPTEARIVLFEAADRILPGYPQQYSEYADRSLREMGVQIIYGSPVTELDADGVTAGGKRYDIPTLIWAAGVHGSASSWLDAPADKNGRILVDSRLEVPGFDGVYAAGDIATVPGVAPPIPGIAPAAKQMGRYVGRRIASRISGKAEPGPFRYRHSGDLATIGRRRAIVLAGRLRLKGYPGWIFWSIAHIYFLIGARNRFLIAFNWLWDYLTLQRGARLIIGSSPPFTRSPASQSEDRTGAGIDRERSDP